jgi:hypothetical protein
MFIEDGSYVFCILLSILICTSTAGNFKWILHIKGVLCGAFGWGTAIQNRKLAGSIPDGAIGSFHWHNLSGHTTTLGLTPPLTEISTRNIFWGKGGRCVELTTLPPSCADCLEIWEPHPPGSLRASPGLSRDCFYFTFTFTILHIKR